MKYILLALLLPTAAFSQTKIEAENYTLASGIQTELTADTGAGKNVGYIDAGDYLDYAVTIPTTGKYSFAFRIASTAAASFNISINGVLTGRVDIPNTTGYQKWVTVNQNFLLNAGKATIRITALTPLWNINWFSYTYVPPVYQEVFETAVTYDGQARKVYVHYENGQRDSVALPPRPKVIKQ